MAIRLKTFIHVSSRRKFLIIPAALSLITSRVLLSVLSFDRFCALNKKIPKILHLKPETLMDARWAVTAISRSFHLLDSCLYRCAAFSLLCKLGGFPVELKIGVRESDAFDAHAWVENGTGEIVMEEVEHQGDLGVLRAQS